MFGVHNHQMDQSYKSCIFYYHLNVEENELVVEITRNMVQPRDILMTLRYKRKQNVTTIKQVYNEHQKYKKFIRA